MGTEFEGSDQSSKERCLYAWMPTWEYDWLHKELGHKTLDSWISELDLSSFQTRGRSVRFTVVGAGQRPTEVDLKQRATRILQQRRTSTMCTAPSVRSSRRSSLRPTRVAPDGEEEEHDACRKRNTHISIPTHEYDC